MLTKKKKKKQPFRMWWWIITKLCLTLCNSMECSPPGSSVPGISQARILESVIRPTSRGSSRPRDQTWFCCSAGGFFSN